MVTSPSRSNHLPMAPLSNTISLEIKFQHINFRRHKLSVYSGIFQQWTRLQRAYMEARRRSFSCLKEMSLLPVPTFPSSFFLYIDTHCISTSALGRGGSTALWGTQTPPGRKACSGTELHCPGLHENTRNIFSYS